MASFNKIADYKDKFLLSAKSGMNVGGLDFIARIQKTRMSGRGDGLKVRTGTLRRSWFPITEFTKYFIKTQISTNVKYARVHEYGGNVSIKAHTRKAHTRKGVPIKASRVSAHSRYVPPRLKIRETFKKKGQADFLAGIRFALKRDGLAGGRF
jgi:phage gpG-like protein